MHDFYPSSDKAKEPKKPRGVQAKYPWERIEVGFSFTVQKSAITLKGLSSLAYKWGKRHNCKFNVVEHDEIYEVARIK